ncbi:unnamed protein product, partial [Polarella glacialis]
MEDKSYRNQPLELEATESVTGTLGAKGSVGLLLWPGAFKTLGGPWLGPELELLRPRLSRNLEASQLYSQLREGQVGRVLCQDLEKWTLTPKLASVVLLGVARQRLPGVAELVLRFMASGRVGVNEVHFNIALSACGSCSQWQQALRLLGQMHEEAVLADKISHSAAITAAEQRGLWQLGLGLLYEQMPRRRVLPDHICHNAAISSCEKASQWQVAVQLLRSMPEHMAMPDVVSHSSAISACEKGLKWKVSLRLLGELPQRALSPNEITCNAAISSCEKGRQWELALNLLLRMPEMRIARDRISANAGMSACEKCRQWQLTLSLLEQMPRMKSKPNDVSYNAAISACEKAGQWQEALGLLRKMHLVRVAPDDISLNAVIGSLEMRGPWQLALSLLRAMRLEVALFLARRVPEVGCCLDDITYNAAIAASCGQHQWLLGLSLLHDMTWARVACDTLSLEAAAAGCAGAGSVGTTAVLLESLSLDLVRRLSVGARRITGFDNLELLHHVGVSESGTILVAIAPATGLIGCTEQGGSFESFAESDRLPAFMLKILEVVEKELGLVSYHLRVVPWLGGLAGGPGGTGDKGLVAFLLSEGVQPVCQAAAAHGFLVYVAGSNACERYIPAIGNLDDLDAPIVYQDASGKEVEVPGLVLRSVLVRGEQPDALVLPQSWQPCGPPRPLLRQPMGAFRRCTSTQ